ncbi:MAG: dihydroorotate dehydrogenase-like protein [Prolixibacteraceae bacterium]
MIDISTKFMGLALKNPIVAGSSGLTNSVNQIKQLEEAGVAAVVLKSLFEEQIKMDVSSVISSNEQNSSYPEAEDYIRNYTKMNSVGKYLDFLREVKAAVSIPIIASINCTSVADWTDFAREIEAAGADAIELNIYEMPIDRNISADSYDKIYIDILRTVKKKVKIPVAVKIGPYFSNIIKMVDQLIANGAAAVVMFNKFYTPDFNLDTLEYTTSEVMSSPADLFRGLRWTGLVKGKLPKVEIAASTGIHDGDGVIKQLLAGASVVQVCSTLYLNGFGVVGQMQKDIEAFMNKWNFESLNEFRGRLSYQNIKSPSVYERAQFMKYFSDRK